MLQCRKREDAEPEVIVLSDSDDEPPAQRQVSPRRPHCVHVALETISMPSVTLLLSLIRAPLLRVNWCSLLTD